MNRLAQVHALVSATAGRLGRIDILVASDRILETAFRPLREPAWV